MTEFVVHSIPGSPFGRAVLATLEEKGAPYRLQALTPGQHKAEPYLSMNPFGRVPALQHGDFILYETQAILRYLDRILPTPALTPSDPKAAARMDQLVNVTDWYLFQGVANVIAFQRLIAPRLGLTTDEAAVEAAMPKAHAVFAELSRLLGDQPYFGGATISLADIAIACQMDFMAQTPEWAPLTAGRANLPPWLDRMNARPSLQATTTARLMERAQAAA